MGSPFEGDERYQRQMLLPAIGASGQARLRAGHAMVAGCGALGGLIVDTLARAGVGTLTIVDRDLVEITNLQRQLLFDEHDVEAGMPKAEAARRRVAAINRQVTVHARVEDLHAGNVERFARGADVILDGLDNFETRYLLNDLAVRDGVPYVHGGAVGTIGTAMTILPHPEHRAGRPGGRAGRDRPPAERLVSWTAEQATPCLRCVFPEAPPPGSTPTCDTAGVLGPVVSMVAAHQLAEAIKLLVGAIEAVDRNLLSLDAWANTTRRFDVRNARPADGSSDCPCCGQGVFDFLEGGAGARTTVLCGRDAVQISPSLEDHAANGIDLAAAAERLAPHGTFTANPFLLRGVFARERGRGGTSIELTLFPNGRAIIKGTTEEDVARAIYARYVGS